MTTYRERRLAKAERLRNWAAKREHEAAAMLKANEPFTTDHAFNTQPGHIPLRARIIAREDRAFESLDKARDMTARAASIEKQADRAIYNDDPDAAERLEKRITQLEAKREQYKTINALYRKGDGAGLAALGLDIEKVREQVAGMPGYQQRQPFPTYSLTNLGQDIARLRQRLVSLKTSEPGRYLITRYPGQCDTCDTTIDKGAPAYYRRRNKALRCEACEQKGVG